MRYKLGLLFCLLSILSGCYSFKGVSISPDVNTFFVQQVKVIPEAAPPDTPEKFMEELRLKIRGQSRLKETERDPNIEFDCTITTFILSNEAATTGNDISLNKLTISVKVNYISNINEDDSWNKTFSFGIPFDPSEDLTVVQDGYIDDIFEQIAEQVFNEAFTDW